MLQFPFMLPVPQAWQRTQSRMLSHIAWKPWGERQGGTVRRQPRERGRTSPLKGRAGEATLHPHPSARARPKRGIIENKQLTRDL